MAKTFRDVYVGIDIHRSSHAVALLPAASLASDHKAWRRARCLEIKNSKEDFARLASAIASLSDDPLEVAIAIDQTGHLHEPLAWFLFRQGYRMYFLEPKAVKGLRQRFLDEESKTDIIDARSMAFLLYLRDTLGLSFRICELDPLLTGQSSSVRLLLAQRFVFVRIARQLTNRLHAYLAAVFPNGLATYPGKLLEVVAYYPTPADMLANPDLAKVPKLSARAKAKMLALAGETVGVPGDRYRPLIQDVATLRQRAIASRDAATKLLQKEVDGHPYGKLLLSFPCLGYVAAGIIIRVIRDMSFWPNDKAVRKALGVYAYGSQSGASPVRGRRGREGSRVARGVLFMVVLTCITSKAPLNDFRDYYHRHVANGKPKKKAIVATMGKLVETIYHCLDKQEDYVYQGTWADK